MRQQIAMGLVGLTMAGGTALGGIIGLPAGFDFQVQVNGDNIWQLSQNLDAIDSITEGRANSWIIEASATIGGADWDLDFTVSGVSPYVTSGPSQASISSAFTVTNNNASTQHFTLTTTQLAFVSPSPTEMLGSHSGNVGDNPSVGDGATLAAFSGSYMYDAQIDGLSVMTLNDDPFSVAAAPFFTNSYGPTNYGWTGGQPAVLSDIRIINDFTLTGLDNAGMTSTFIVRVPSPGTIALLAMSGLVVLRRGRK